MQPVKDLTKETAKQELIQFWPDLREPWYTEGAVLKIIYLLAHLSLIWLVIRLLILKSF